MPYMPGTISAVGDPVGHDPADDAVIGLRDARATIASQAAELAAMKAEIERLTANNKFLADSVYKLGLDAGEQTLRATTAEAALKAAREALDNLHRIFLFDKPIPHGEPLDVLGSVFLDETFAKALAALTPKEK